MTEILIKGLYRKDDEKFENRYIGYKLFNNNSIH